MNLFEILHPLQVDEACVADLSCLEVEALQIRHRCDLGQAGICDEITGERQLFESASEA